MPDEPGTSLPALTLLQEQQARQLRRAGYDWPEVAQTVGAAEAALRAALADEEPRTVEAARLDFATTRLHRALVSDPGNVRAAEALVRTSESRRKLMGLDAEEGGAGALPDVAPPPEPQWAKRARRAPHWDEMEAQLRFRVSPYRVVAAHAREHADCKACPKERTLYRFLGQRGRRWFLERADIEPAPSVNVLREHALVIQRLHGVYLLHMERGQLTGARDTLALLGKELVAHLHMEQELGLKTRHAPAVGEGDGERVSETTFNINVLAARIQTLPPALREAGELIARTLYAVEEPSARALEGGT